MNQKEQERWLRSVRELQRHYRNEANNAKQIANGDKLGTRHSTHIRKFQGYRTFEEFLIRVEEDLRNQVSAGG